MRRPYLLAALATGALWALAWPAVGGLVPLAFGAWIPLLVAEERFARSTADARPRHFMPYVMLALLVWNLCTTWWLACVSEPFGTRMFTLWGPNLGNMLLMALPWLVMRRVRRSFGGRWARLALVVAWVAFERFHMHWDLSWPWLTLGNVFAGHPAWIQWYELTGALGGSVWVWAANLALLPLFLGGMARVRMHVLRAVLIIAVPWIGSWVRYATFTEQGTPFEAVIIQPDIDPYKEKFGAIDPMEQLERMLAQAGAAVTPDTRLIVLPETALQEAPLLEGGPASFIFQGLWENDLEGARSLQRIRAFLREHPGASLVAGMSSMELFPVGGEHPYTARILPGTGRYFDAYNAALFVRPDGSHEVYHKSKLVPGVELMPFEQLLGPLGALALDLGGTTGSLGTQEDREVLTTKDGNLRVAPVICYESIYGDHVAAHVRNGATSIAIMTNDGWWEDTPGYRQHLAYGRLRAVETRRSILRSANTGISCTIDQRGDVHQATAWWTQATLRVRVLARADTTFFVRHGDLIGIAAEVLAVAIVLVLLALPLVRAVRS